MNLLPVRRPGAVLGLLMFFILFTLFGWNNDSSFNAVIQSMLISGAGKSMTALRRRGKAEAETKSVDELVDEIVADQSADAAEDAGGDMAGDAAGGGEG